jgi:hypothetical protein
VKTSPAKRVETQCLSAPDADQTGQSSVQIDARIESNSCEHQQDVGIGPHKELPIASIHRMPRIESFL